MRKEPSGLTDGALQEPSGPSATVLRPVVTGSTAVPTLPNPLLVLAFPPAGLEISAAAELWSADEVVVVGPALNDDDSSATAMGARQVPPALVHDPEAGVAAGGRGQAGGIVHWLDGCAPSEDGGPREMFERLFACLAPGGAYVLVADFHDDSIGQLTLSQQMTLLSAIAPGVVETVWVEDRAVVVSRGPEPIASPAEVSAQLDRATGFAPRAAGVAT